MGAQRTTRDIPGLAHDGAGRDVLLIGGLADDASVWDAQVAALRDRYRLTRYSTRGADGSPAPPGPYQMSDFVDDAIAALDAGGIEQADIVGSSLGGAAAQWLAILHPARVRTLTLVGSWTRSDRTLRALLQSWIWSAERSRSAAELLQTVNRWAYGSLAWNSGAVDDAMAELEASELRSGSRNWESFRDTFIWSAWAALAHDSAEALSTVTVPTLLVAGEEDAVLGARYSRELAALLPDSRLELIAGTGHQPFQEDPASFNALLESFLAASAAHQAIAA